jgi:hypothetical protein
MTTYTYAPTRETVEIIGIANVGQERPGDPGHGVRLYAVRGTRTGHTWQATEGELRTDGRPFKRTDWPVGAPRDGSALADRLRATALRWESMANHARTEEGADIMRTAAADIRADLARTGWTT